MSRAGTADDLDPERVAELREIFELYDADEDGRISLRELASVLRCLGQDPDDDDIEEMVQVCCMHGIRSKYGCRVRVSEGNGLRRFIELSPIREPRDQTRPGDVQRARDKGGVQGWSNF
jgi:hypothetical protein